MHQRISRRSALISGGAALFLSVTGQFSEHSPALATQEADVLEVFNRENSPSHFFRIPFMVSTANDTLVIGCDANRATTGDSADNIDALIRRKPNASRYEIIRTSMGTPPHHPPSSTAPSSRIQFDID